MLGVRHRFKQIVHVTLTLSFDAGKVGKESAAAKFASATPSKDFSIQDEKPYAEVRPYRLLSCQDVAYCAN